MSRGLQQKELADSLGLGPSYISSLERGWRINLGDQMLEKLRIALQLTDVEVQRIRELREVAAGKLAIPCYASEEEAAVFRLLTRCVGRMPPTQLRAVRQYLESWLQMTAVDITVPPKDGGASM